MMKKYFAQPELQVVRLQNHDIVTYSPIVAGDATEGMIMEAPERRLYDWDAGY